MAYCKLSSKSIIFLYYHVNIISKLMTEFLTELAEIVHLFSTTTNFSFKPCRATFFSLQIYLSP